MDYIGPFDTTSLQPTFGEGAFANWQNANPSAGDTGSTPSMESVAHPIAEIMEVIKHFGLEPDHEDLTQLRQAIQAAIAAAVASQITVAQVLSFNRVYPHALTGDNKLTVVDNADGTVTLAADQAFVHRGLIPRSTNDLTPQQRTVAIPPDSTGHLRWRWNGGNPEVVFGDLADSGYNPTDAADVASQFDTGFDDMLISRVERDGSGAPEITPLRNAAQLSAHLIHDDESPDSAGDNGSRTAFEFDLDWARTPNAILVPRGANTAIPQDNPDTDYWVTGGSVQGGYGPGGSNSRYAVTGSYQWDFSTRLVVSLHAWV